MRTRRHPGHAVAPALLLAWAPMATADEPLPIAETERVFMPEFEFGAMVFSRADVGVGFVARTSIEYRAATLSRPFARLTYDTTSASFRQPGTAALPPLRGTLVSHDILLGGGHRFGSDRVQGVVGVQGGLHLYALPRIVSGESLAVSAVSAVTRAGAAVRSSLGLEVYVTEKSAVTVEGLGQRLWGEAWEGSDGWAAGALVGFTVAL